MKPKPSVLAISLCMVLAMSACGDSNETTAAVGSDTAGQPADTSTFTLQLLHFSDADGSDSSALRNVASLSALVNKLRAEQPESTLVLSSGDNYIPGPRFAAAADESMTVLGAPSEGRADIAFLNAIGVQASAVGNHELDLGPGSFASIITADGDWPGASFPYLSANTDFSTDPDTAGLVTADGSDLSEGGGKVAGWVTETIGNEQVGILGAGSPTFPTITSVGDLEFLPAQTGGGNFDIQALAATLQQTVDSMRTAGLDKIIMLSHMQQLDIEKQLATLIDGVDIIVAGGSNTLLADSNDNLRDGESASDTYPLQLLSSSGEPVLVVNTAADFAYLGRLIVSFNENGVLVPDQLNDEVNGVIATTQGAEQVDGVSAAPDVLAVRDALNNVLVARDGNVLGYTSVFLEGRRSAVRNEETNLGNLTADANQWYATQAGYPVDISLKNGGGIRAEIGQVLAPPGSTSSDDVQLLPPAGNSDTGRADNGISQLAIETALKFNNKLWVFDITGEQLVQLLEHSVAQLGSQGRFPQVAGIAFSYDPDGTEQVVTDGVITQPGSRIRSVRIGNEVLMSDGAFQVDSTKTYRMVTLSFLAEGGDGYPFPTDLPNLVQLDEAGLAAGTSDFSPAGREQDALAEYLQANHGTPGQAYSNAELGAAEDQRIQNLSVTGTDTVCSI